MADYYPPPPPPTRYSSYYQPPPPGLPQIHHLLPPPYAVPSAPSDAARDELRTLFIAGLPDDVRSREIYNLFRQFPGYESSKLRTSGRSGQAYAFAVFADQQSAIAAMHALNGMIFDLERDTKLFIELAKENSRSKRSRTDDEGLYSYEKKVRRPSRARTDSGDGSNMHMPGKVISSYSMNGYPSTQRCFSDTSHGYGVVNDIDSNKLSQPSATFVPQNNKPCPTLFVANLGPSCTEDELNQVFSSCEGFLKLKMQRRGLPAAFVDFKDVACSSAALDTLQGRVLRSSVGEGMRLEYAKARMGIRRRDRA